MWVATVVFALVVERRKQVPLQLLEELGKIYTFREEFW